MKFRLDFQVTVSSLSLVDLFSIPVVWISSVVVVPGVISGPISIKPVMGKGFSISFRISMGFSRWFWFSFSGSLLAAIQRICEGISMCIVVTSISNRPVSMNSVPCKSISISLGISMRFSISFSLLTSVQIVWVGIVVSSVSNRQYSVGSVIN